ncbi:RlmE family RNA methyltransferase [Pacificispira sp.]|uniref:RlmE family RNA methyltransferase n=1 Tax=Pacificispira sp. TaxID=2888761 RepID=UPI003BA99B4A
MAKKSGKKGGGSRNVTDARGARVRVKTARGRKLSSTLWLERQLNDPYVAEARRLGYRGRAAFKLAEIDDKHNLLKPGSRIVDLGCAPGGWTQVALQRCGAGARVVGIDLLECDPIPGAILMTGDFMDDDAPDRLKSALGGQADIVLSDMAANTTGHPKTDHLRIVALVETAYAFAQEVLAPGGAFVAKVFSGGTEGSLLNVLKLDFERVFHMKPPSSRKESPEMYVVALGFRRKDDNQGG